MQNQHSPAFQELLTHVEAALIQAGKNARALAEQTNTPFITVERAPQHNPTTLHEDGASVCPATSDKVPS